MCIIYILYHQKLHIKNKRKKWRQCNDEIAVIPSHSYCRVVIVDLTTIFYILTCYSIYRATCAILYIYIYILYSTYAEYILKHIGFHSN